MSPPYSGPANQAVLELVPPTAKKALDLGCGSGDNARVLQKRGCLVDGVTFSKDEAAAARNWCRRVLIHDLEFGLPKGIDEGYDVILLSHTLEHLRDPTRLLKDIHATLTQGGGTLIVAIPNPLFYKNRFKLLAGRIEYEDGGLMDSTHYKWYSYRSARILLEEAGFEVLRSFADGSAPLSLLRKALPKQMAGYADSLASRMFPGLFGYQLLYVARRRESSR